MYKKYAKRLFDFSTALLLFLMLFPVFITVSLLLFFANKGKVFFTQKRPGKNEKIFSIIKFRSMTDERDSEGNLLPDAERLTWVGKWVRVTSLDELPQLLNVLKGEMSFIGPRPLLIRYLDSYTDVEKQRHSVRPGITGLAQVSGRNTLGWDQRLAKDVYYVNNLSFALDFHIIVQTIKKVLMREDVVVVPNTTLVDLDEYRNS